MTQAQQQFATLPPADGIGRIGIWIISDEGNLALSESIALDDIDQLSDDIEVWQFPESCSSLPCNAFNKGTFPILDRNGMPLWKGARITFAMIEGFQAWPGTGIVDGVSHHGAWFTSDVPMRHTFKGVALKPKREHMVSSVEYQRDGDLKGSGLLRGTHGDYERGTTNSFVELADDPRSICELVRERILADEASVTVGLTR